MSFRLNPLTGALESSGSASPSLGSKVIGADPNAILSTDSAGNLSDKVLASGQLIIGSTGAAPVAASLTGTSNQVIVSSAAGSITLSLPQSIATTSSPTFSNISLSPSGSLDLTTVGTLAIGTFNASIINIGNSGATVNIQGTTLYENVTQLQVKDPLITLNKGGGTGSASNSGLELEEAGSITAFAQTSADRASWTLKAPSTSGIVNVTPGAAGFTLTQGSHDPVTVTSVGSTPNASGASLSSQALTLQPANATNPGVLTASAQTIGGDKTFTGAISASNLSGTNTGDQTITLLGDVTGNGTSNISAVLATVNATPGTFGANSSFNTVTVNAKGLVTSITNSPIQIAESQVTNLVSDLAGKQPTGNYIIALTGDGSAAGPGSAAFTLATVNLSPGTTGSTSSTSTITTNAKGLVTSNTSTAILIAESQVTGLVADLASKQPTGNYITALSGDVTAAGPGSSVATLATVNLSPGITGSASSTSTITTNAKGLVTANTSTPIQIAEAQVTGLITDLAAKLTSVSVAPANGLAGTSSGGSTPTLTLSTTVTGLLKGNGVGISAAVAGTDYQAAGNYITALTGDAVAAGPGSAAITLATVNSTPGTTGSASAISVITTNAKGLVTAISSAPIQITETQVTNLVSDLAGKQPVGNYLTALIGDGSASGPGSGVFTLASVNSIPGLTGSASSVSTVTTNAKGLVTSNTSVPIQITEAQVTNLVSDLASKQPAGNYITALTGDAAASGPGSSSITLATVNATPGAFGTASSVSTITTNAKGLVTVSGSIPIQIVETQVTGLVADLASKVTAVSVVSANGLAGTSSGGSTPALTLSTTVTGVLKGNGTTISAAVAGVDYQASGNYVTALTGDATGSGPGATALTLATVNAAPGTTGSASSTSIIITNAKGLVTSNTNTPIQISEAQVTNLVSDLASKQPVGNYITALTGDAVASGPGSAIITLVSVNITPGTTGSASSTSTITTNAKGLVTSNVNTPIQITEAQVTGLVTDLASKLTSVSVVSANGLSGISSGGSTPAITLSTTVTGLLKGNGIAISAAVAGTDYQAAGSYLTALTGDATASGPGSAIITLASVNSTPGTIGVASAISVITSNAKGLVTSISSTPIQIAESQVTNLVTDLASKISSTQKGAPNGVAPLDATSKIPATYLPSYVDEVQPFASLAAFPATGATNIIYIANDSNKVYRWSGVAYIEISASPGSTDAVPEGSVNLYFTSLRASTAAPVQSVAGRIGAVVLTKSDVGLSNVLNLDQTNPANIVQTASYRFSTDVEKAYWNAKQPAGSYLTALTGDVTAAGPGSSAATVVTVGGASASSVATSVSSTLAATSLSTISTIVKRDVNGASNFKLLNLDGSISGTIGLAASATQTAYTITLPSAAPTTGTALVYNGTSYVWSAPSTTAITSLLGDATASGPGASTITLATVNSTPGTFGTASAISVITTNAKGLVTSISSTPIQIAEAQVTNLVSDLAGKQPTGNYITSVTGDVTGSGPGATALTLATVNANIGTFNSVTVNAKGLVTAASNVASQAPITLTTTGTSGAATFISNTLNIPQYQATGSYITALTGDITATGPGSSAATLATVNLTPGIFGSASSVSTVTVNGKGLVTASSATAIQIAESQVTNLVSDLAGKQPTGNYITSITGDAIATGPGAASLTLATVNATPGITGSASSTSVITTNGKGLVTSNTSTPIQITESQVTGLVSDLASKLTSVSVASANGFAGTSSGTSTPTLTLTTTITGLLKGNGTAISAAVAGTDYQAAGNYITALTGDATASGPGSTAITLSTVNASPGVFGSTSSVNTVTVNAKGLVTSVTNAPIAISAAQVTSGILSTARGGTGVDSSTAPNGSLLIGNSTGFSLSTLTAGTGITISNTAGAITVSSSSAGSFDIPNSTYSGLVNNIANQSVTGFVLNSAVTTFESLMYIAISATANTFTALRIVGVKKGADWSFNDVSTDLNGDSITGLSFGITSTGQVQISIGSIAGFTSGTVKFRAITIN